jgi:iron complex transport system substrate-binding protein
MPPARIVSLLPSATEIVGALELADQLVGVTHECDVCPDAAGMRRVLERGVERVTVSEIQPHAMTQAAIDRAVKSSLSRGLSLYGLREDVLVRVRPSVVLTQALCSVCAPDYGDVRQLCQQLAAELMHDSEAPPEVVNLEPATLADVADSFVAVATACGVPERGVVLKREFEHKLDAVRAATLGVAAPRVLLLEWLDPPFNAGHWVPEQIEAAGGDPVTGTRAGKSKQLSWDEIEAADPDVIVVACCGFDLERNGADLAALLRDTSAEASQRLRALRAVRAGRLYALDGNRYYARPAPSLAEGSLVLARVIHAGNAKLVERLEGLDFLPAEGVAWARASVPSNPPGAPASKGEETPGFGVLHEQACALGQLTYADPDTGYRVFTRLGLERRGTCCGCGCRHCPYGHVNVEDKAARSQQPAFLHRRACPPQREPIRHVLFWSGGKDSLLALRAWLRATGSKAAQRRALASLTLLTTFDAKTRVVAHQEVNIADVQRQARALDLDLVGVPLHPGLPYLDRVQSGLDRIAADGARIESLIFGDLHLDHVKLWRDSALGGLGHRLEYPLWQVAQQVLFDDLLTSGVPCVLSACPGKPGEPALAGVDVGRLFDGQLVEAVLRAGWDPFGENGEFHTLAQVWLTSKERALGIEPESAG